MKNCNFLAHKRLQIACYIESSQVERVQMVRGPKGYLRPPKKWTLITQRRRFFFQVCVARPNFGTRDHTVPRAIAVVEKKRHGQDKTIRQDFLKGDFLDALQPIRGTSAGGRTVHMASDGKLRSVSWRDFRLKSTLIRSSFKCDVIVGTSTACRHP